MNDNTDMEQRGTTSVSHDTRDRIVKRVRTRWAAIGAAVAVTLGAGGIGLVNAGVAIEVPGGGVYRSIEPCRLLDTRPSEGVGGRTTPLGPGETAVVEAFGDAGNCENIPDYLSLQLNVTALSASELTHLTIWSGLDEMPTSSSLNPSPNEPPTPNAVATGTDDGRFSVFNNSGTVHVIIDLVGVYETHDHDSRYYVKNEVYNKAEMTDLMADQELWVAASGTGTRISGSRNTTVTAWPSGPTGRYVVTFPRQVEGCAMFVSLNTPNAFAMSATVRGYELSDSPNDVFIYVVNAAGVLTNAPFSVQVKCPFMGVTGAT